MNSASDKPVLPPSTASKSAAPATNDDLAESFRASKSALRDFSLHSASLFRSAFRRLSASSRKSAASLGGHVRGYGGRVRNRLTGAEIAAFRARLKLKPVRILRLRPALLPFVFAALAIPMVVILYLLAVLPVGGGISADSQGAMTFESANGDLFAARGVLKGQQLGTDEVPEHLRNAIVAIEDRRFFDHHGIDVRGLLRAAWRNTAAGGVREGGSTITQQLARLLYLSPERSIKRKTQEMLLALWLESKLSKDEILTKYLNTAFFGAGAYGIDAAARRYFGKSPKELSLAESAMLAGLVRAPSQLAPTRNFGGAKERSDVVLQAMVESGRVSAESAEAARAQDIKLRTPPDTPPGSNFFVDMVAGDFRKLLGAPSGDVRLQTTLDLEMQNLAQGIIERRLEAEGAKRRVSQAALVALRRDGAIVAMVGGRDYEASQFNRAVQARRQAGSLFKVFVYDAALQRGYTPSTTVVDRPVRLGDWEPENYSGGYRGPMSLRNAFASSVNTVAVQIADEVGIPAVVESARRLGVQSPLPALPSIALGAAEVTLLEMTKAYAAIGFGLQSLEPYAVRGIVGPNQQTLYTKGKTATEVAGPALAARAMMLDLMQAVVDSGTGKAARLNGVPVAGKTGTTQEYRDAWFIGFTPELAVGVWLGNDDNAPMANVTGGDMPARIWKEFVEQVSRRQTRTATVAKAPAGQAVESAERVRGRAEVIDAATLAVNDRTVPLFGVEPNRDVRALRALARYLRRREVVCVAADGGSYRCEASGQDIAEAVLAAGVARASANASPELLAVEEMARAQRIGMWRS